MNQRLLTPIFIAFLLLSGSSYAQIGLKIPAISNASAGQDVQLPITVSKFDSIVAFQFVLRWDPTVIQFVSVDGFNLPGFDAADVGTFNALDSGFIRVVWEYYTNAGTSLPDGSTICRLNLKVVGPLNSGTSIIFTEIPPLTYFEFSKANNQVLTLQNAQIFNGFVAVGYTITDTQHPFHDWQLQVFPNPFFEKLNVQFHLENAEVVHLTLVDVSGRVLASRHAQLPTGKHHLTLEIDAVPTETTYFLIISTNKVHHAVPLTAYN